MTEELGIFIEDDGAEAPFTMVPNEFIRDSRVPPNAKMLLIYLMSHKNGYQITYQQIERETGLGRYAINSASKLLSGMGWLTVKREKLPSGHFGPKSWRISRTPKPESSLCTTVGHSTMEPFHYGTTNGHKEKHLTKKTTYKDIPSNSKNDSLFEEFWDTYPRKVGKESARRVFMKLAQPGEATAGAKRMRDDPNLPEKRFIPYPQTWLNREGWQDEPYPPRVDKYGRVESATTKTPSRRGWIKALHDIGEHFECAPGEFGCK